MDRDDKKYWIVVASKDHIQHGIAGGFIQANHGKKSPMKRLSKGDRIICYSSKQTFGENMPYQKFTAIGEIKDEEPYIGSMYGGHFKPFRRNVKFYECEEVDIKPLIPSLSFIKNKAKWGYPFMRGFFEIPKRDFQIIANEMLDEKRQQHILI